jgi:hypothetical protein
MQRNKNHESIIMMALSMSKEPATYRGAILKEDERLAQEAECEHHGMSSDDLTNSLDILEDMGAVAQPNMHCYRITLKGYQLFPEETGGECE